MMVLCLKIFARYIHKQIFYHVEKRIFSALVPCLNFLHGFAGIGCNKFNTCAISTWAYYSVPEVMQTCITDTDTHVDTVIKTLVMSFLDHVLAFTLNPSKVNYGRRDYADCCKIRQESSQMSNKFIGYWKEW